MVLAQLNEEVPIDIGNSEIVSRGDIDPDDTLVKKCKPKHGILLLNIASY